MRSSRISTRYYQVKNRSPRDTLNYPIQLNNQLAVLQRLVEYLERSQELRDEARAALAYPVVLTGAMGVSILVLLTYVLPKFSTLFSDMGKTLPLSARIVMTTYTGWSFWRAASSNSCTNAAFWSRCAV